MEDSNGRFINPETELPSVAPTKNVGFPLPPWKTDPKATAVNKTFHILSIILTLLLKESFMKD